MASIVTKFWLTVLVFNPAYFSKAFRYGGTGSFVLQHNGFLYKKQAFETQTVKSFSSCSLICEHDWRCESYNFNLKSNHCLLYDTKGEQMTMTEFEIHVEFIYVAIFNKVHSVMDPYVHRYVSESYDPVLSVLPTGEKHEVVYDMETAGGGWLVIQRRFDGSVDFYRNWQEYKEGFGTLRGEFWFGLEKIHQITKTVSVVLRFDIWDFTQHFYAEYENMVVQSEADKYRLVFGNYRGNAGNALLGHRNAKFSTKDNDNDWGRGHCSVNFKTGWWSNNCHQASPNGLYLNGTHNRAGMGIMWRTKKGYLYSFPRIEMKIRRSP